MNKRLAIGMITIGQSPREDIVPEICQLMGIEAEILECGALDGLTPSEIEKLASERGESVLVSRLRDGSQVKASRSKIIEKVEQCIASLVGQGVDLNVLLCSELGPGFSSPKPVIAAAEAFSGFTLGIVSEGDTLGIMIPAEELTEAAEKKWKKDKVKLCISVASPYRPDTNEALVQAAKSLKEGSVDLVAMDCLGYTMEMKRVVREITGKPIVLVRSVIANIIREIAD